MAQDIGDPFEDRASLMGGARPTLAQASETLFVLKQSFDNIVYTLLSQLVSPALAKAIGVVVSVNILTGFVIAVFAVAISEIVRTLEEAGPG